MYGSFHIGDSIDLIAGDGAPLTRVYRRVVAVDSLARHLALELQHG